MSTRRVAPWIQREFDDARKQNATIPHWLRRKESTMEEPVSSNRCDHPRRWVVLYLGKARCDLCGEAK